MNRAGIGEKRWEATRAPQAKAVSRDADGSGACAMDAATEVQRVQTVAKGTGASSTGPCYTVRRSERASGEDRETATAAR